MVDIKTLPEDFQAQFAALSAQKQQAWHCNRERAQTDLLYLATEILGFDFQETPHRHLFNMLLHFDAGKTPLYDLSTKIKKWMVLWPRGTFKTSAIIVLIVAIILNYPNVRICFMSGGDALAKRQLGRVLRVFERPSAKFQTLFPEYCDGAEGTTKEFTVPCRTAYGDIFAEPTMAISTAKSVKAGSHYDIIFVDDLVNETNYRSPTALAKCIQDYKDICPLLAPMGFMFVTGTRYSFGDLYEDIQRLAKEESALTGKNPWKFSILPCWVRYCRTCKHKDIHHDFDKNITEPTCTLCDCKGFVDSGVKDVLFPRFRTRDGREEGHTVDWLQGEQIRLGDETFANQYLNAPMDAASQTFTPELLDKQTFFDLKKQAPAATLAATFFIGDLSYVGNDKRDLSVIYVCRYWKGHIYVVDCIWGKWDAHAAAENLFAGIMKHRPSIIWLEQFLGWDAYNNVFQTYANNHGVQRLPVEWLKMSCVKDAKVIRIGAIKPWLKEGRLWLYAGLPQYELLCEQLKKWPKLGRHDDFADCLGLVCGAPTGAQMEQMPVTVNTAKDWLRKLHAPSDGSDEGYGDSGGGSGISCGG